jgi:hypothetical protein
VWLLKLVVLFCLEKVGIPASSVSGALFELDGWLTGHLPSGFLRHPSQL